jgi:hypothetical protein
MMADLEYRQGSHCQIYDHSWRPTSLQGQYMCRVCGVVAYCPGCLLTVPLGATKMRCERHKEGKSHA